MQKAQRLIARQLIGILGVTTIAAKTGLTVDEVCVIKAEGLAED